MEWGGQFENLSRSGDRLKVVVPLTIVIIFGILFFQKVFSEIISTYNKENLLEMIQIKNQGSAVFFPSFIEHQAEKVTKGKRYSLAVWWDGPHWR